MVSDGTYHIHADRLGGNVVMTDANAKVVAKTEYTAYGAAVQNTRKDETAGYTGHYEDPLTGLTYMQARYYDADLGRFLSVDPVLSTPGDIFNFARYAYTDTLMMFTGYSTSGRRRDSKTFGRLVVEKPHPLACRSNFSRDSNLRRGRPVATEVAPTN